MGTAVTWRDRLRPLAFEAFAAVPSGASARDLRRAFRVAWDGARLGPRRYWPYRVWLEECARVSRGRTRIRRRVGDARQTFLRFEDAS